MKKLFFTTLMLLTFAGMAQASEYEMEGDTAVIKNMTELIAALNQNQHIRLEADLTVTDQQGLIDYLKYGDYGWCAYTKTLNGNGHKISNFVTSSSTSGQNNVGVVRHAEGATIKNLTLEGCNVQGDRYVGGICGYANNCHIINCHVTGTVYSSNSSKSRCGGIVGEAENNSIVEECTASVNVNGDGCYVGGIAGYLGTSKLVECHVTGGSVYADGYSIMGYVGGIIGCSNYGSIVSGCTNKATVSAAGEDVGGIIGYAGSTRVSACINYAKITNTSHDYTGGIAGEAFYTIVKRCINYGDVIGKYYVGGIVGEAADSPTMVTFCYSKCNVQGSACYGGLAGSVQDAIVSYCLSDVNVNNEGDNTEYWGVGTAANSAFGHCCYIRGAETTDNDNVKVTEQLLKSGFVAYHLGTPQTVAADEVAWRQNIDIEGVTADDYPVLCITADDIANHAVVYAPCDCWGNQTAETYSNDKDKVWGHNYEGDICTICGYDKTGTKTISNLSDLCQFSYNVNHNLMEDAVLTAPIRLTEYSDWESCGPIGGKATYDSTGKQITFPFTGTFDGQEHSVAFTVTDDATPHNLFGAVKDATIKNLWLTGAINTKTQFAAPIVNYVCGDNTTTIENCCSSVYINSTIDGDGTIGGLVAVNEGNVLNINGCSYDGTMALNGTTKYCGGFVGYNKAYCTVNLKYCLMGGYIKDIASDDDQTATFVRHNDESTVNIKISYCRRNAGLIQGTDVSDYALSSGEVTYRLNDYLSTQDCIWRQSVDNGKARNEVPKLYYTVADQADCNIVYLIKVGTEYVYTNNDETAIDQVENGEKKMDSSAGVVKTINNGRLIIMKGDKQYTIGGARIQ